VCDGRWQMVRTVWSLLHSTAWYNVHRCSGLVTDAGVIAASLAKHRSYLEQRHHQLLQVDSIMLHSQSLYFTFRMLCSSEISIQWLLRLVVDVAVSSCQRTVWLDTCAAGAQLSVVAGRSGCRSVSFSLPTYVGCMSWPLLSWFIKTHSPRDSTGFLSPGRGSEGSSMVTVTTIKIVQCKYVEWLQRH